jgi:hypothetical protein
MRAAQFPMEVSMRRRVAVVLLVLVLLAAYRLLGHAVLAQEPSSPLFEVGQLVDLAYPVESGGYRQCRIGAIRGDFIRCDPPERGGFRTGPVREDWFNTRTVMSITRIVRQ